MQNYASLTPHMLFSTDPLRFVQTPKNQTAFIGESVWFHCAATGSPKPKVTWLKHDQGGRPLDAEKYKVFKNGSLMIKNVRSADSGRYFCIAATRVDLRQKTVHLVVKGKSIPWLMHGFSLTWREAILLWQARVISRIERSDKNYKNANITKIRWCSSHGLSVPWISQKTMKKSKTITKITQNSLRQKP